MKISVLSVDPTAVQPLVARAGPAARAGEIGKVTSGVSAYAEA